MEGAYSNLGYSNLGIVKMCEDGPICVIETTLKPHWRRHNISAIDCHRPVTKDSLISLKYERDGRPT